MCSVSGHGFFKLLLLILSLVVGSVVHNYTLLGCLYPHPDILLIAMKSICCTIAVNLSAGMHSVLFLIYKGCRGSINI